MIKIKEMPYSKKYTNMLDSMKLNDTFIPIFVQKHLGDQAVTELRRTWQEEIKLIPDDASFEEKYETAYANWVEQAKSAYSFIRRHLGEDGIEEFKRAEVEALKRKNAGPALFILRLVRTFSPGSAFTMIAKQMSYQIQWLTPLSVSELTRHRAVVNIPRCKTLDFPDTDDLCFVSCQSAYPMWLAEQFKLKMKAEREGNSCTITLTPLG